MWVWFNLAPNVCFFCTFVNKHSMSCIGKQDFFCSGYSHLLTKYGNILLLVRFPIHFCIHSSHGNILTRYSLALFFALLWICKRRAQTDNYSSNKPTSFHPYRHAFQLYVSFTASTTCRILQNDFGSYFLSKHPLILSSFRPQRFCNKKKFHIICIF